MSKVTQILWMSEPAEHNYPSAISYLSLHLEPDKAERIVKALREAPMSEFKARDIFRASGLPLLGISSAKIKRNHEKIEEGKSLSPLLLVRSGHGNPLVVADGYHRMCSVYTYDEDALIPCKIV